MRRPAMVSALFLALAATALRAQTTAPAVGQVNPAAAKELLAKGIEKVLFVRRFTLTCSHIYTEHVDARWTPGGGLGILDLKTGAVRELLPPEFSKGVVNRFDLSFDATRVVFDFKRSAKEGYRIYEIGLDGQNLRQLTFPDAHDEELIQHFGRGADDMHPCYLPDGNIAFTSTRTCTTTLCDAGNHFVTAVIHRMDANGKNIQRLSNNPVSEFAPTVLPDGRIMYMRWEYNRKGAGAVKCLWSMFPDGSGSAEIYGNQIVDPETMIYGRPVPGSPQKISFLGCSHWGPNNGVGTVVLLDTTKPTSSPAAMTFITKDVNALTHGGYSFLVDGKWVNESTGTLGRLFKDPYPLSEELFLVAQKPKGLRWSDPKGYDLSLIDAEGRDTLLFRDPEISCWHPYPVRTRPVPPVLSTTSAKTLADENLAQCILMDVYRGLQNVPRGSVKYLRIMEQTGRPWTAQTRWKGDNLGMAHTAIGYNTLGMQAQHGIVPVEEDGSANFYLPADRNIYFQVLDEQFRAIQTERTYINYRPGEVRSCVGCHENSNAPAVNLGASVKALQRAPSRLMAQSGESQSGKLFDYARQIQPIWDRACISCHSDAPATNGGLDLTGKLTEKFSVSYENLLGKSKTYKPKFVWVGKQTDENDIRGHVAYTPPYFYGAYSSLLAGMLGNFEPRLEAFGTAAPAMLEHLQKMRARHAEVKLTSQEILTLNNWLDSCCVFYPSYWGQKNMAHAGSPFFRPEISFQEGLSTRFPEGMRGIYEPVKK